MRNGALDSPLKNLRKDLQRVARDAEELLQGDRRRYQRSRAGSREPHREDRACSFRPPVSTTACSAQCANMPAIPTTMCATTVGLIGAAAGVGC